MSLQRPMSPGYLYKPPGLGRRVTTTAPPDPQMAAHVGYLALNHLSPYAGSAGWPDWELPFLQWAEGNGYAIDVVTNADLEDHPDVLLGGGRSLFLSVGHDEYWSGPMRDTVEGFIGQGGNAAFLSGNTSFWQVRLEDPTPEGPAATMVGYKGFFKQDPVYGTDRVGELTSIWSDHLIERPENHMTGVSFARGGYHRIGKRATAGRRRLHDPPRRTTGSSRAPGLGYGDLLGAGADDRRLRVRRLRLHLPRRPARTPPASTARRPTSRSSAPHPPPTSPATTATRPPAPNEPSEVEFIASRLFGGSRSAEDVERISYGHAVLGTYTSAAGGVVVTSGSTDWAHGLAGRDPQVEQITRNILDRLGHLTPVGSYRPGMSLTEPAPTAVHRGEADLPFVDLGDAGMLQLLQVDLANGVWIIRNLFDPGLRCRSTSTRATCTPSPRPGAGTTWRAPRR